MPAEPLKPRAPPSFAPPAAGRRARTVPAPPAALAPRAPSSAKAKAKASDIVIASRRGACRAMRADRRQL